jgi:hypothetical protein
MKKLIMIIAVLGSTSAFAGYGQKSHLTDEECAFKGVQGQVSQKQHAKAINSNLDNGPKKIKTKEKGTQTV